eukprot:403344349
MQFLNENTQEPQFSEETRLFYVNKFASQLLKKHLLPDMIFQMFLGLNQNQVASNQLQYQNQDPQKVTFYQEFARFFANSSFKQKHYLITNYMSDLQSKFQQNSQMIGTNIPLISGQQTLSEYEPFVQLTVQLIISTDNKQIVENQLQLMLFTMLFIQQKPPNIYGNFISAKLLYILQKAVITYSRNFHNDIDDQIFREAFITLTLSEDLDLQNSSNIIYSRNQPLMFHHLLNLYLQILYSQYKGLAQSPQLMNTLLKKELKHFRINELIMSDWIQKGKQKYVLNFMRIFGQDFISFNELNLVKCLNFKLKQQPQNQGFFQILDDCQDLNQVMISCINFIENIEFKIDDKSLSSQANSGMISFILEASENSLNNLTSLKKEHLVYVILRDSKLFELRDKVVKIPQLQCRVLNYYLPKIMEEKQIQVLNLLKEIEIEYPEIHLQMKSCLRNLGMYNEEFGIQVSQEQYNDKVRIKLQDVNIDDLLSILSHKQNSFTKWESLLRINYTVELVDITLEELGQFIKRDYKLENQIFELIKIPYHKSSQTLIEQIKDQEQSFLKSLVVQLLFETIHICLSLKNQKDQQQSQKQEFEMLISEISTMVHLILVEESEIIQMIHQQTYHLDIIKIIVKQVESVQFILNFLPNIVCQDFDNLMFQNFATATKREYYNFVFHFKLLTLLVMKFPIQNLCDQWCGILDYIEKQTGSFKQKVIFTDGKYFYLKLIPHRQIEAGIYGQSSINYQHFVIFKRVYKIIYNELH